MLAGPSDDAPLFRPTSQDVNDVKNGPLAKAGGELITVYRDFLQSPQGGPINTSLRPFLQFRGNSVGVDVKGFGDFNTFQAALRNVGMDIQFTDPTRKIVEGYLPVASLPAVASLAQTVGIDPIFKPIVRQQGVADNQGDRVLFADVARTQFNVTGAGVTIGVISDSANRFQGGLADSVATGDLPSNVNVLLDGPAGSSDEGRAMLEQIFDIAPGSALAFTTGFGVGPLGFAAGVRNLARTAGAQVIVDDVGLANEPLFQDGLVAQAVTDVTVNNNVTYFSSAGNSADHGYESNFRGTTATVGTLGSGRFMDFDPGAGTLTQLPITVTQGGTTVFWWDNPFFTNNGVTSDLDIFVLDAGGNVVAQGIDNNLATQVPQEIFVIPGAGNFTVAIRVNAGSPDVSRLRFQEFLSDFTVSQQFGSAGGTIYPTTFGHPAAAEAIGVGAVPYYGAPPFTSPSPIRSEVFSSLGPVNIFFDPNGNRLSASQLRLKPDLSAPDGVNTSFFIPGFDIDTTNPPFPPATPTNLDPDTLPNFFGTSSSAPNLAAVAALMKQLSPAATRNDVFNAMRASAVPLNGSAQGAFDPQGGFGLVDARGALTAIDQLRVVSSNPANGSTIAASPASVTVTFSKDVDPTTITAADLIVTGVPAGLTAANVQVDAPIRINATTFQFPIRVTTPPGVKANGQFSFRLADGAVRAVDGSLLVGSTISFTLNDAAAPQVIGTIVQHRVIVVQFSEGIRAETVNAGTILLVRTGSSGVFGNPTNTIPTNDPRVIYFFDFTQNRAIIDLRALPQVLLPTDIYALVVTDQVRDIAGNQLDGEFSGIFPSGNGAEGGTFAQGLGLRTIIAPQVSDFNLVPGSDTGIAGDLNTNQIRPTFVGQVLNSFPGTLSSLTVAIQYAQDLPPGTTFDTAPNGLKVGAGGRGFSGVPSQFATTDAEGRFTFTADRDLRDGFHRVRIVVIGDADAPPLPGLSSQADQSFRVDTTNPLVVSSTLPANARINALTALSLNVADPVSPVNPGDALAVPTQLNLPALDPATANNISNYSLYNLGPDRALGGGDDRDFSSFIGSATFVSTTNRVNTGDPYTGRVDLTFNTGLPAGAYLFVARSNTDGFQGLRDAAGNSLDADPTGPGLQNFGLPFDLQPGPAFVTQFVAVSPSSGFTVPEGQLTLTGPRSVYEIPTAGFTPRAEAPPIGFAIDFSAPLTPRDYSNAVQLIRSADGPLALSDGDFGTGTAAGFTRVAGATVELTNQIPGATLGQFGFNNRLVLRVPAGTTLAPDQYRIVIGNSGNERIIDLFGNQIDAENLGNVRPDGNGFEVLMPDGTFRQGLTGNGVAGGGFVTGFTVVPPQRLEPGTGRVLGNIIYSRPDYNDDPFLASDDPDGSRAKPFPTLAPEAIANFTNGGDLNSAANFLTGFDPRFDRNGNGRFDRSAFVEASRLSAAGPVVIVALPGNVTTVPGSSQTRQATFVLQAPSGTDPVVNDGSASVPDNTLLSFAPGSALKLLNASLYVQNQGSAVQILGTPNERVNITSFADDTVGGDTNGDGADTNPRGGDWGGLVLRNFDDVSNGRADLPAQFPIDGKLGRSGADDVMSTVNFATIRYGGGAVPRTIGTRFDSITLFNSRPSIANTVVADGVTPDSAGGTQAAISADVDSFREDLIARGPLIRRTTFVRNSINGLLVRANAGSIQAQQTDAIFYPDNPQSQGGDRNFVFDDPVPHVLVSQLVLGQDLVQNTGGTLTSNRNRLYVEPGMLVKFRPGASIALLSQQSSINVGDRTYINQFDANPNASPLEIGFRPNTIGDAKVLFTTLFDDNATTTFFDPTTGQTRTIVAANLTDNDATNPAPTPGVAPPLNQRWGSISVTPGAIGVFDEAEWRFGGGSVITPSLTFPFRSVLDLTDDIVDFTSAIFVGNQQVGARVSITNNDFFDNFDAPIVIEPDGLLAADPLRPLQSGNPFFRGNVMQRNDVNGLAVKSFQGLSFQSQNSTDFNPIEVPIPLNSSNLNVNSVWDDTDVTYVVRGSIVLAGYYGFGGGAEPLPDPNQFTAEERPNIALTIQAGLPDTLLANGTRIARPGEPGLVKLLNDFLPADRGPGTAIDPALVEPAAANPLSEIVGAGFVVGYDDGVDPPTPGNILPDQGVGSQIRIVGIGANETTGQQRVPVVITSLRDASVGRTIRGVDMSNTFFRDPVPGRFTGAQLTAPAAGDGGHISYGGNSLTDTNLFDPRNGNLIDNADIRFIHRIEIQGGSVIDAADVNLDGNITILDAWRQQKLGLSPEIQFNSANSITISNSNLSTFRDAGVYAHPGFPAIVRTIGLVGAGFPARVPGLIGQPNNLFLLNNTIANMPVGVRVNSDRQVTEGQGDQGGNPATVVLLHNTFVNNPVAFRTDSPAFNGMNSLAHVYFLAMNNIFANSTDPTGAGGGAAVRLVGQATLSEMQFNLFSGNDTNVDDQTNTVFLGNKSPVFGSPNFVNAGAGDFRLAPGSAAIDSSLSEFGPLTIGDALFPIVDQRLNASGGVRNTIGRSNPFGGLGFFDDTREIVTLPGLSNRSFADQFVPVLPGSPGAIPGPATNVATYNYLPITGERDQLGFLRIDDPTTSNVGFGSRPFFDIGANELRRFFPPFVTNTDGDGDGQADGVIATVTDPAAPGGVRRVDIYSVGGIAGTNGSPRSIRIQFNERLDPGTVNNFTVLLQASGGDGQFGNNNSTSDRSIDLSGKLVFDPNTRGLTINLGASNLNLGNDVYRIILRGTGSNVIRDPEGNALDGENLDAAGLQRALPSGDGLPGGDFVVRFSIDTNPPQVVAGTFGLAASSDSGIVGDRITNVATPTFVGRITDVFPPAMPLLGQQVFIDVSTRGDLVFDRMNAGTGTTDANGNFAVTIAQPLPNTPFDVGPDGILGTGDDSGYSIARVRVIDQSGNVSTTTLNNANNNNFVIDTRGPRVTSITPSPNTEDVVSGGIVTITFGADENLDPASLNANTLRIVRTGGDGTFGAGGTTADVQVPLSGVPAITFLRTRPAGAVSVSFAIGGTLPNDIYRVTLSGSGTAVTDRAGNALDGEFTPGFPPSGNGQPGGDFTFDFVVGNASATTRILYVSPSGNPTGATGTRNNPFRTIDGPNLPGPDGVLGTADDIIQGALKAARIGDTVAVLPGTYLESINLRSLVKVRSAATSSTDTTLVAGSAFQTIVQAATGSVITVNADGLFSTTSLDTEFSGFTVFSPLSGGGAVGTVQSNTVGIRLSFSDVLVRNNVVIDSNQGIAVEAVGGSRRNSRIESNLIAGNNTGIVVNNSSNTAASTIPVRIANNTIVFNTTGVLVFDMDGGPTSTNVENNIFWQNNDRTAARNGQAILAPGGVPTPVTIRGNLFSGNGPNLGSPADDVLGVAGFNPAAISTAGDPQGNLLGDPFFVAPRDPRPKVNASDPFDGPSVFLSDANYNLNGNSAAIDNAINALAPARDFLNRGRVDVPGRGRAGFGPADIGAFEMNGTPLTSPTTPTTPTTTSPLIGNRGVAGTPSAADLGVASVAAGFGTAVPVSLAGQPGLATAPDAVIVTFSRDVDRDTVEPTDLELTGQGLDATNPARAMAVEWLDDRTARFVLAGQFAASGLVRVALFDGAILAADHGSLLASTAAFDLAPPVAIPMTPTVTTPIPVTVPVATVVPPTSAPTVGTPTPTGPRAALNQRLAARRAAREAATANRSLAALRRFFARQQPA